MKLKLLVISFLFFLQTKAQIDTIPPVITMLGKDTVWNAVFANYIDAGATAFDLKDGNVAVSKSGTADISILGIYIITYHASDSMGNQAIPKRRVIIVKDTIKPKIEILGPNPFYFCKGSKSFFIDPGCMVTDNYDQGIGVVAGHANLDVNNYGIYQVIYFASDQSGNTDTVIRTVIVTGNCAYGRAFFDKNKSCSFDSVEKINSNFKLLFKHLATSVTTTVFPESYGYYGVGPNLDTGDYLVKVIPFENYLRTTCAADSFTYKHTPTSNFVKDIPFFDTLFSDVSVNLSMYQNHRWNFENLVGFYIRNFGTLTTKIPIIEFSFPAGVTIKSTYPAYDSVISNKVFWHVDTLISNRNEFLQITYTTDTSLYHLNDTISFSCKAFSSNPDIDTNNNSLIVKKRVVGSYDPNEKYCAQPNLLKPGTTDFNYTVVFQNTGNAEAFEVVVVDTIDSRFDINTLQVTEGSHRFRVYIKNNIITVRFVEINLPDSHSNEPQSHGFFSYSLKLKKPLSLNEEIKNTAYIYFDNNPAIITNTTLNKYVLSGINNGIDNNLGMYPNPANSVVRFQNPNHECASLIDMLGHEVLNTMTSSLDISALPPGIYILKVGQKVGKLIKE